MLVSLCVDDKLVSGLMAYIFTQGDLVEPQSVEVDSCLISMCEEGYTIKDTFFNDRGICDLMVGDKCVFCYEGFFCLKQPYGPRLIVGHA